MRFRIFVFFILVAVLAVVLSGCACGYKASRGAEKGYGDLMVGIIVSQPLTYYYGTTGYLEVWGPDGIYLTKEIPMYMGNQIAIFRHLPIGRYIVSLSYSGMVVTKCAVLCGSGEIQWRADCTRELKDLLSQKKRPAEGNANWRGWGSQNQTPDFAPEKCPGCGHKEPCQTTIIFKMPEDALKYDP